MSFTSLKLLAEMIIQTIITSIQDQRASPVTSRKDDLSRQQPVSIGLHSEENATIGDKINWDTFSLKGPSYVLSPAFYEPI